MLTWLEVYCWVFLAVTYGWWAAMTGMAMEKYTQRRHVVDAAAVFWFVALPILIILGVAVAVRRLRRRWRRRRADTIPKARIRNKHDRHFCGTSCSRCVNKKFRRATPPARS